MFFKSGKSHTGHLFKELKILKSFDKSSPEINGSNFLFESHSYEILDGRFFAILKQTKTYGRYSMMVNTFTCLESFTKLPS